MATANPTANVAVYRRVGYVDTLSQAMTIQGAVVKTAILLAILLACAVYTWTQVNAGSQLVGGLLGLGFLGGFVMALVTAFFPKASPVTAPIYAGLQGLALGGISALFDKAYQGIVIQAVELSLGVLAIMLFLYGLGLIRATEKFKIGVVAATGAICLVYLVGFVMSLFGTAIPYIHSSGWIGIGFSLFVVVIAALNLVLDFDFIEKGAQQRAPKYMEWYGAFTLMVTLVWMYLEILRLLSKMRDGGR